MTRRTAKRPAVRVRWELEEYTLSCSVIVLPAQSRRLQTPADLRAGTKARGTAPSALKTGLPSPCCF